jgi:cytochrome d ubiquinol oxidase subunit I
MSVAALLSSALFVGASAAWHLLRGNNTPAIRAMFSMALWMTLIVAPIQAMIGDMHGLNTLKHQPAKNAAIEGHWENPPANPPAAAVWLAGYGAGAHPLWSGDPGAGQPDPDPQSG